MLPSGVNIPGAKAAAKAFIEAKKGDVVDDQEIMRRSQICGGCPRKQRRRSATTAVSRLLGYVSNKHRVPDEISRYNCGACGCSFMLLIPSKTRHPDTEEEKALRPSNCWMLTTEEAAAKKSDEDAKYGASRSKPCANCS